MADIYEEGELLKSLDGGVPRVPLIRTIDLIGILYPDAFSALELPSAFLKVI